MSLYLAESWSELPTACEALNIAAIQELSEYSYEEKVSPWKHKGTYERDTEQNNLSDTKV